MQLDGTLETIIETDASSQVITIILSQYHIVKWCKQLHPVEYKAKTVCATQRNWLINNQEMFPIVDNFRKWRDRLVGLKVNVYTDHRGLQYINTK